MGAKQSLTIQTLVVTLIANGILLGAIYWLAGAAMQPLWWTILGIGLLITLVLWFIIQFLGRRLIDQAVAAARAAVPAQESQPAPAPVAPKPAPPAGPPPEVGAVQILSILQRQGRLIDFLQEDLAGYDDAQIGAAVRSIQESSKQALTEYVKLEPIFNEAEGSMVTVQPGFDPRRVRLTGAVVGQPPFRGELRHRGWRVARIDLPKRIQFADQELIVAAAEVEVGS